LINFIAENAHSVVAIEIGRVITNRNNLSTIGYTEALPYLTIPEVKSSSEGKLFRSG
jgi:hypothetical protein